MLIIARKQGQHVELETADGTMRVLLYYIGRRWVKLGIEAPESVMVKRGEIDDLYARRTTSG